MKNLTKSTIKWILHFCALCALSLVVSFCRANSVIKHKVARIGIDDHVSKEIDLTAVDEPYEFVIDTPLGKNTFSVMPGKIAVIYSDCPDQICVNQGYIESGDVPIVCLPHKLDVTIIDGDREKPDAIAGRQ